MASMPPRRLMTFLAIDHFAAGYDGTHCPDKMPGPRRARSGPDAGAAQYRRDRYRRDSGPDRTVRMGKLLATGGVSQLEGAGGGGLTPWALITGYGSRDAIGGNVHYTVVGTSNFQLQSEGAAIGIADRVEISFAHEMFDTGAFGGTLGIGKGFTFAEDDTPVRQSFRLFGDAIYAQDSWIPQVSVGTMYKDAWTARRWCSRLARR